MPWRIGRKSRERVVSIWDNGEILIGFGEFLENNKSLVPSAYNRDWWAADLAESLDQPHKVIEFAEIMGLDVGQLPSEVYPSTERYLEVEKILWKENGGKERGMFILEI